MEEIDHNFCVAFENGELRDPWRKDFSSNNGEGKLFADEIKKYFNLSGKNSIKGIGDIAEKITDLKSYPQSCDGVKITISGSYGYTNTWKSVRVIGLRKRKIEESEFKANE